MSSMALALRLLDFAFGIRRDVQVVPRSMSLADSESS
jgi:hypothetical protein